MNIPKRMKTIPFIMALKKIEIFRNKFLGGTRQVH